MSNTAGLSHESLSNIGFTCEAHASKPDRLLVQQAFATPDAFIGRHVKKSFPTKEGGGEHMWVLVKTWDGEKFIGELANDPVLSCGVVCGDEVTVNPEEIEDIC